MEIWHQILTTALLTVAMLSCAGVVGCSKSQTSVAEAPAEPADDATAAFIADLGALVALDASRPRPLHFDPAAYSGEGAALDDLIASRPGECRFDREDDFKRTASINCQHEVIDGRRAPDRVPKGVRERELTCKPFVDGVFRAGRTLTKPILDLGASTAKTNTLATHFSNVVRFAAVEVRRLAATPESRDLAVDRCLDLWALQRDMSSLDNLRSALGLSTKTSVANVCAAALAGASRARRELAITQLGALLDGTPNDAWSDLRNRVDEALVILRGRIDEGLIARAPLALRESLSEMRVVDLGVTPPSQMGTILGSPMAASWNRLRQDLKTLISLVRAGTAARLFHEASGRWPRREEFGEALPIDARTRGAVEISEREGRLIVTARAPSVNRYFDDIPTKGDHLRIWKDEATRDTPVDVIEAVFTADGQSPAADELAQAEKHALADREAVRALSVSMRRAPAPSGPVNPDAAGLVEALTPWLVSVGFAPPTEANEFVRAVFTRSVGEGAEFALVFYPGLQEVQSAERTQLSLEWRRARTQPTSVGLLDRVDNQTLEAFDDAAAKSAARLPLSYTKDELSRLAYFFEPAARTHTPQNARILLSIPSGMPWPEAYAALSEGRLLPGMTVRNRISDWAAGHVLHVRDEQDVETWRRLITQALPEALEAFAEDAWLHATALREDPTAPTP